MPHLIWTWSALDSKHIGEDFIISSIDIVYKLVPRLPLRISVPLRSRTKHVCFLKHFKIDHKCPTEIDCVQVLPRTVSRTGSGAEINIVRPQVHDRGSGDVAMDEGQGADKGVSVKKYLVKTLRPEDDDKALSPYNYSSIVMNRIYPKRPSRRFHIHQEGSKEPIGGVVDQRDQFTGRLEDPRLHLKIQEFTSTNWRHQWDLNSIYQSSRMTGPVIRGDLDEQEGTPPLTKEQIERYCERKDVEDVDLKKPFKEALRTPLSHRIIEFVDGTTDLKDHLNRFASAANSDEWPMSVWCRMFQQTLDGSARGWFERLLERSINEWYELREAFAVRYSVRKACFKEPHEITKIVRRENESLMTFKERWTVETMEEMMVRLDDFVRSEEAFSRTELPKGEAFKHSRRKFLSAIRRDDRPHRNHYGGGARRNEKRNNHRRRDNYDLYRGRDNRAPYPPPRGDYQGRVHLVFTLDALTKPPKEILVTKTQLRLPPLRPMLNPSKEAEVEGYLVRWVYVDEGASVEVMFERCFKNLSPTIMARLRYTQTDLVGFVGEVNKPLRKIKLEHNHRVISNESIKGYTLYYPLNDEVSTQKGIATLVMWSVIILEFCWKEKKQMIEEKPIKEEKEKGGEYEGDDMKIFVWEPADIKGVPQRIITHSLNVNASIEPICQKQRIFAPEKSEAVAREVVEWVKAGIVWPVGYPTWISNPVLVKKCDGAWRMCIDFKNLNSACPKDYYPFPNIDFSDCDEFRAYVDDMNITKENKDKYRWTAEVEEAFQQMKKLILNLPSLTTPLPNDVVLLIERKRKQCPIHHVSQTLNEAERNYALMEKLALSLHHMTRRLRRYFEAHSVKVITDQPVNQMLRKIKASANVIPPDHVDDLPVVEPNQPDDVPVISEPVLVDEDKDPEEKEFEEEEEDMDIDDEEDENEPELTFPNEETGATLTPAATCF
ncbi:reverse transcriptase domain-containing protein [Tanacetum coccineum]|uniref:Reverse transcriptase domain-containing protein n=1 Tax=Tanacetum coccineum TaxID=301880 RepID=A0ABQ4XKW5_9ASTR